MASCGRHLINSTPKLNDFNRRRDILRYVASAVANRLTSGNRDPLPQVSSDSSHSEPSTHDSAESLPLIFLIDSRYRCEL